ncbi:MAG: PD-(D/E)XK nuclease family protein [bacterium]|nr:PD-(D/E)XK nuclease family protein [bacterium]
MLKELIDKFYLDRERSKNKDQTRFYITDAGKCPRSIFFKFKKAPKEDIDARVLRMFDHGDYIHRLILNTLFSLGLVRSAEIGTPPQKVISGRADAILSWENELYVLDIKSINSFLFKNLNQPKDDNVNQLQLYLHFFSIKKGILLYVNKDTQELKEFIVIYDRQRSEKLLKELDLLKDKIDKNIIPKRLSDFPSDKECQFCQFKEICKQALASEMPWKEFKRKLESQQSFL